MCGHAILYAGTENLRNLILSFASEIDYSRVPPPPKKNSCRRHCVITFCRSFKCEDNRIYCINKHNSSQLPSTGDQSLKIQIHIGVQQISFLDIQMHYKKVSSWGIMGLKM